MGPLEESHMHTSDSVPESPLSPLGLFHDARGAWLVSIWELSGLAVARYYAGLFRQHGKSSQALDERLDDKEREFYKHLFQGVDLTEQLSVLDIGCGMGDLIDFLQSADAQVLAYLGIDIVEQFVDICRDEYLAPCRFQRANFISKAFAPRETFNLIANMGVMVSRVFEYEAYIAYSIEKMLLLAEKEIVFNVITEVDTSLGNYRDTNRIGGITFLPRRRLIEIVERAIAHMRASYHIHEARIYPDATDAFVRIIVRP
jgi:SAM-dependent methyltransferase